MRVAVVGCGYWGSKHVRVLVGLPEVEHVCVVDPRVDRRVQLGGQPARRRLVAVTAAGG